MFYRFLKTSILLLLVLSTVVACKKDDTENNVNVSTNETNGKTTAVFNDTIKYGSLTDTDGNVYKTVTIGTQTWMAENLRTTKYNDGTEIPNVIENNDWINLTDGAYCNFKNSTNLDTIATFGRMYNWFAVNTGKLAPQGWHVMTRSDFETLNRYLISAVGSKLKEVGNVHWNGGTNSDATNETGFTAVPAGDRLSDFFDSNYQAIFWLNEVSDTDYSVAYSLIEGVSSYGSGSFLKKCGLSVRCVKD